MKEAPLREPATKQRPAWIFPALLVAQFVVLLLVLELGLAWFHPVRFRRPLPKVPDNAWTTLLHRRSTAPGLKYELNPGASADLRGAKITINSLGFRGNEVSARKPQDTLRIAAMGASVAFGWTVLNEEAYPAQLERLLNERTRGSTRRYEVLNFGVGGYATRDEAAALEAKALPLEPDLIIVDYHPNGPESEPVQPLHQVFHEPLWWEKWNLLRLIAYGRRQWGVWALGDGSEYRYLAAPDGPHWPTLLAAFDKIQRLCAPRGLHVVLAVFPTYGTSQTWNDYPYADLHAQVREAAEKRGFLVVDMLPVFAGSGLDVPSIAADAEHPNAAGLLLAAHALERAIVEHHQELLNLPPPGERPVGGETAPR